MDTAKIFNIQAEKELLGSLLTSNNSMCQVIDIIEPLDLYKTENQLIYETMVKLFQDNRPFDIVTIAENLGTKIKDTGGITYLGELAAAGMPRHIKEYASIIKEKSNMRLLQNALRTSIKEAEDGEQSTLEITDRLQSDLLNIKVDKKNDDGKLDKPMIDFMNKLETRYKNGGDIQGIKTHLKGIDGILNGLNKEEFIIVAARPSMGKSAFSNNIAIGAALKSKAKVNLFSLEMSRDSLLDRIISSLGKISMDNIKTGKLQDEEWRKLANISGYISNSTLRIYDSIYSLNGIIAECKKRHIQEGVDVIIIDYLQLITTTGKFGSREQEVSHISRQLKLLAKELKCTVIALAQLSRAPEQRADHRPILSDLRESGGIEQDADIVVFLYRDEYYNAETEEKNIIETLVSKNRNGELGTIKLAWVPQYQLVGNLDLHYEGKYDARLFKK
jgi:replicative DNA helicase